MPAVSSAQAGAATAGPLPVSAAPVTASLVAGGLPAVGSTPRKVFAHYLPSLPVSLDDAPPATDYYARNYLAPTGEGGRHAAYGGFLRDRPLPRAPRGAGYQLADFADEVRQARSAGIDGFSVDLLVGPGSSQTRVRQAPELLLQAAAQVDPRFSIMLMPDMTGGLGGYDVPALAAYLARLGAHPSAYRLGDGRLVVSPFKAEKKSAAWWRAFVTEMATVHDTRVALLPVFLDERPHLDDYASFAWGVSNWGARSPAANPVSVTTSTSPRGRVAAAKQRGLRWMQPVSAQDARPRSGTFQEAENLGNLRNTWEIAIASGADLVQLTTWNDYAEGSQFAPSVQRGWGVLEASAYYLRWWKTGLRPTVTRDTVVLTHRVQPVAALPSFAQTLLMRRTSGSAARDTVEAMTLLTAPGTVTVTVGGVVTRCAVPAGPGRCLAPLRPGRVSASVTVGDTVRAAATSPHVVTATPWVQDLGYVVATGAGPSLSAAQLAGRARPVGTTRWRPAVRR